MKKFWPTAKLPICCAKYPKDNKSTINRRRITNLNRYHYQDKTFNHAIQKLDFPVINILDRNKVMPKQIQLSLITGEIETRKNLF